MSKFVNVKFPNSQYHCISYQSLFVNSHFIESRKFIVFLSNKFYKKIFYKYKIRGCLIFNKFKLVFPFVLEFERYFI